MIILYGLMLFLQGWKLDPILVFGQLNILIVTLYISFKMIF